MKKKSIGNAKFLVEIFSPKNSKTCETRSILDLRINSYWEPERRLCKVQISVGGNLVKAELPVTPTFLIEFLNCI